MSRKKQLDLTEAWIKRLKLVGYLVVSGALGYLLAQVSNKPELTLIFAPAINYLLVEIEKEIKGEGITEIVRAFKK